MEFNGLPALSNGYIVDGLETNDPLTNLNSGLSTNLVLGLNSISEVTVNTLSYSVDQGRYGASQVNYVTKSGTNQFHGNLYEIWNGSLLNAADFFTNATPGNHKPRSTVNHFGGSLGGPDRSRQAVFLLRQRMGAHRPAHCHPHHRSDSGFQQYVLQQLPLGGTEPSRDPPTRRRRSWCRFTRTCSRFTATPAGRRWRFWVARLIPTAARPPARPPTETAAPTGRAFRIPATITNRCRRRGWTTTSTTKHRLVSVSGGYRCASRLHRSHQSLFNSVSPQPLYSFAAGYTHVFSQNLVNYFNPAFSWYSESFRPERFAEDARGVSDRACRAGSQCSLHHPRRTGQHLAAGTAGHSFLYQ